MHKSPPSKGSSGFTPHLLPKNPSKGAGFTLVELLIVIGVLAILATTAVVVLNPAELIARGRDAKRNQNIETLDKLLGVYEVQGGSFANALEERVYISLPDSSLTCGSHSLPTLPAGWEYRCSPTADHRKTNGTGWIPIDFTTTPGLSVSTLPIDPTNSAINNLYYSYIKGSWELTANFESKKWLEAASKDGGDSVSYEKGTNVLLSPVLKTSFSFSSFPTTTGTNQPAWRSLAQANTPSLGSDSEGDYVRITGGAAWYEYQQNIPFNPSSKYKLSCRVRQIVDPSSGGKAIYCGVSGVASDGTTYINATGANTSSSQHYFASGGNSLTAGAGYTTFTGYFKGHGTPAGGQISDINNPGKLYPGVAYIRPMFILNYNGGDGTTDIDFEMLEIIE